MRLSSFKYIPVIMLPVILWICMASGCHRGIDPRLAAIAEMADDTPAAALEMIDSIDRSGLPEADRHYLDLLSLRARDKAFIRHSSDSLVLDVMGYYESHESHLYPEAHST